MTCEGQMSSTPAVRSDAEPPPLRPSAKQGLGPALRSGVGRGLDGRSPTLRRELLLAFTLLTLVGLAVYGTHLRSGGFLMDDWSNAAKTRYLVNCCKTGQTGQGSGYVDQVGNLLADGPAGYHIGLPAVIPFTFFLFRSTLAPHLAIALMLGVAVAAGMYAVLRHFRVAPLHALLMAALSLLFPWSDASRVWAMAGYNQLAVVLWLGGLLVALRGLRSSGLRALLLHVAALTLYAAGIAVYELVAGPVLVSVAFYLHRTAGGRIAWRAMAPRWVADIAVTAATLAAVVALALERSVARWQDQIPFAAEVAGESVTLLGFAAVPFAQPWRWAILVVVVAILAAGAAVRNRRPGDDPARAALGHWLVVAAAGVLVVAAGYLMAIPGGYGRPLLDGIENRVNLVAGSGYVMLIYATAAIAGILVVRAARRPPAWAAAVPVTAALVIGGGYVSLDRSSAATYDRSFARQLRVLQALRDAGPFPAGSLIFPFGYPSFTSVGVPVFAWTWDLAPASKVVLDDPSSAAFPVLPGTTFTCYDASVLPENPYGLGEDHRGRYGQTFFVDIPTGRTERLDDRAGCERAVAAFAPGPLMQGRECELVGKGPATRLDWSCRDGEPPRIRP